MELRKGIKWEWWRRFRAIWTGKWMELDRSSHERQGSEGSTMQAGRWPNSVRKRHSKKINGQTVEPQGGSYRQALPMQCGRCTRTQSNCDLMILVSSLSTVRLEAALSHCDISNGRRSRVRHARCHMHDLLETTCDRSSRVWDKRRLITVMMSVNG
jgi:hypothetical protein